jgi:hypothetical protein
VDALLRFKEDLGRQLSDTQTKNQMKASYTFYHLWYEFFISHYFEPDYAPDYGNQRCRNWCLDKYLWLLGRGVSVE